MVAKAGPRTCDLFVPKQQAWRRDGRERAGERAGSVRRRPWHGACVRLGCHAVGHAGWVGRVAVARRTGGDISLGIRPVVVARALTCWSALPVVTVADRGRPGRIAR